MAMSWIWELFDGGGMSFSLAPLRSDTHLLEAIAVLANFELREAIAVVANFDLLS